MRGWAFLLLLVAVLLLPKPAESWWRRRRRRRSPPPVPPPPSPPVFRSCTNSISETSTEADGCRVVGYAEPEAPGFSVRRTGGPAPGSRFCEGSHQITYEASNSVNQRVYCSFTVTVTVPRCPNIPASSPCWHSCSKTNIVGSTCSFHCPTEYNLVGQATLTCRNDRTWSQAFPTCQEKTCSPRLTAIANGGVSCSNSNRYNSVCTFRCNSGYGFRSGDSPSRTCGESWSGATPMCIDTQPPRFSSCPSGISVEAEDALISAVVSWDVPTATDNVPSGLMVNRTLGKAPGSRFYQGSHTIQYRATDRQGNTKDCTFSVTVRVIVCRGLIASSGLVITCFNGHIKGASCTFQCVEGYQLVEGSTSTTCQSNGLWDSPQPTCQILRCPTLTPPARGSFRDAQSCGNTFGSWCYFMCDAGYHITGSAARRCRAHQDQTSAFWDGTATQCQIDTCQKLPPGIGLLPVESDTCPAGDEVTYGSICSYECAEGYLRQGGPLLMCGEGGQWLQTLPQCEEITCASSDLPTPTNGEKSGCSRDREPFGTTCILSCSRGYTPTTAVPRMCQNDGTNNGVWSGGTIHCTAVTCSPLSAPTNGFVSGCVRSGQNTYMGDRQLFDTTCSFACNEGYTLLGTSSRNCLVSGGWDGSIVECVDMTAPMVQCPPDQVIFAGEGQTAVSVSWQWEPVMGTDAGHDIPAVLLTINSAPVTGSNPTTLDEGIYSLVYSATDGAGNSGSCTMQIEARVTRCIGLNAPINGDIRLVSGHGSCTEGAVFGSQCEISCDVGYALSTGNVTLRRQCSRVAAQSIQGYWTLQQPTCEVNSCALPTVTNGYISGCHGDSATYGDTCEFHCDPGHRSPSGHSYRPRQCQADGSWSGADFQCTVTVTCPGPFSVPHGTVQPATCGQDDTLPYDTVCRFSCDDGFLLQGPAVKTCTDSGSWDNPENTRCLDYQRPRFEGSCPRYVTVKSEPASTSQIVNFDVPTATDNSGMISVNRHSGHLAPGSRFPGGQTTVTYVATDPSGNSAQCDVIVTVIVHRCERLQAPTSGSIQCDHSSPIAGTHCTVECNTGYTLSGSQTRTCRLTSDDSPYWDGQAAMCTSITCTSQPAPPNSVKSGCNMAFEPYGTECSFYCMNGYRAETTDGGRSRCLADGTWSGTDLVCIETECPVLTLPAGIALTPDICHNQPTFGQNCLLSCIQPGFVLAPPGSEYVTCLSNGQWSQNILTIQCVDYENPRFINCPAIMIAHVERGATSAQVDLAISASDNDQIQPTVTCDPGSGQFELGTHWVQCVAMDATGNSAACNFQIEVVERRCRALYPPIFGEFVGECRSAYGSVCQVRCIDSRYQLVGSSEATCEFDGTNTYWQQDEAPRCELIRCEALSLTGGVQVTPPFCTTGSPLVGTLCSFHCMNGFILVGGVSSVVCGEQGLWDGGINNLPTNCEDQSPPVLTFCTEPIYATLEDPAGVSVTFDIPTASDNSPSDTLTLETSPADITSPYLFTETTEVSYTFTDQAGNSVSCVFRVYISDERAPVVVFCPLEGYTITTEMRVTEVTWEEPIFEDPSGDDLVITNNRGSGNSANFSVGTHLVVYTAVDTGNGNTAVCEFPVIINYRECPSLDLPRNGALGCGLLDIGRYCSIFCHEDFDIPRLSGNQRPESIYTCRLSGMWHPHDFVPDCSETRRPGSARLPFEMMYFTGDCNNQTTRDRIAAAFIDLLLNSPFRDACLQTDQCTIDNINVTCGASSRAKRSLDVALAEDTYHNRQRRHPHTAEQEESKWNRLQSRLARKTPSKGLHTRERRDALNWQAIITFDLSSPIQYGGGISSFDATLSAESLMMQAAEDFISGTRAGNVPPLQVAGIEMSLDESSLRYGYAEIVCEPGYVANNDDFVCVACSTGFMYNISTGECQFCPRGYYQEQQAQFSCIQCPSGTSTAVEGANNRTLCEETCPAGSYSASGIVPCSRCLIGEYQPLAGQTSCQACPPGTTTLDFGVHSRDQCLDICSPGTVSDTGLAPCRPCDRRTYQPQSQQHQCVLCPGETTTLNVGTASQDDCIYIDECASSPCVHQATCVDLIDGYRCDCPPGYRGVNCEENIDDCVDHRCSQGATCVDGLLSYTCLCGPGFQGEFCDMDIDECASSPCQHDGVCRDGINGYQCQCTSSYHGAHCELERNSCSPSPCQNGAQCEILDAGYQCLCGAGYGSVNCTIDINECSSSPCQNGGTCQDMVNGYSCICLTGYEGIHCQNDIDLCAGSPCHDGSTCVDLGAVFRCLCPPHRSGDLCEETPCQNGALYVANAGNPDAYTCQCVGGYAGRNCEIDFSECASGPCSNGGTCIEHQINAFRCDCPQGFEGDTCSIDINECLSDPCGAGNTCEDDINGYTCLCAPGLTGSHCQDHIDYCEPSMCQHGATCSNTGAGYQCQCVAGFTGMDCEINTDECLSRPCQHGGFCTDHVNGFTCTCVQGFTGTLCDMNIEDCYPDVCQNGGTCVDGIADYSCVCPDGFTGTRCEEPVNYCLSSPCQHEGLCINDPPGYSCMCLQQGFTGRNCEIDVDDCSSYPCIHALQCVDGVDSYTCICEDGYSGTNCERNIDECVSQPCLNGGTCLDLVNGYVCQCVEGYNGTLCENNIHGCNEGVCFNGGTCMDDINSFRCVCSLGSTGQFCEVNYDDCDPSPCENGGECQDQLNAYVCQCLPGYSGINCEVDIDECQQLNIQCQNGALCIDKVADFECLCPAGYRGRYCEEEINECESNPCQNGAICEDQLAAFSCDCPTGFAGPRCDIQVNLCLSVPCSNGAACSPRPGGFSCSCPAGYSGEVCDVELDECMSQPCQHQGSCKDHINGYQCTCLPGYTGVRCETEFGSDFDLRFSGPTTYTDLIQAANLTSHDLTALSASVWLRTPSCHGDFILMMLSTPNGLAIKLSNPSNLTLSFTFGLYIHESVIGSSSNLCDGRWHNLLLTLRTLYGSSQEWSVYVDGSLSASDVFSNPGGLPRGLMLTIGPQGGPDGVESFELELSGVNIWSTAVSEAEVPDIVSSCRPSVPADVFAWNQMMRLPSAGITPRLRVPSLCDAFDECSSNPCLAGTCEDRIEMFVCHCPEGLEGDRCQINTDYCQQALCLNDAACLSEGLGYKCVCPVGNIGKHCEFEVVDGSWGAWSPFTDCTKTCGGGSQLRWRSCDSPEPLNGGLPCPGEANQTQECNTGDCPACIKVSAPTRGEISCVEVGESEKNCSVSCMSGYFFDIDPLDVYHCGPNTNYAWNHQSVDNPYARFPSCVVSTTHTKSASKLSFNLPQVTCDSASDKAAIENSVAESLAISQLACLRDHMCTSSVSVSNCNLGVGRSARQAPSSVQVTITLFSNLTAVNTTGSDLEDENDFVAQALESLGNLILSGEFTINIHGEVVRPDPDSMDGDSWNVCPEGTAEVQGMYCVECGLGTFLSKINEYEAECLPCPTNTYKDQKGQGYCTMCPYSMVTNGKGARHVSECYEQCSEGSYLIRSDIIGDNRCEPCPLNTFNPTEGSDHCMPCAEGLVTSETGASHEMECHEPLGPITPKAPGKPVSPKSSNTVRLAGNVGAIFLLVTAAAAVISCKWQ